MGEVGEAAEAGVRGKGASWMRLVLLLSRHRSSNFPDLLKPELHLFFPSDPWWREWRCGEGYWERQTHTARGMGVHAAEMLLTSLILCFRIQKRGPRFRAQNREQQSRSPMPGEIGSPRTAHGSVHSLTAQHAAGHQESYLKDTTSGCLIFQTTRKEGAEGRAAHEGTAETQTFSSHGDRGDSDPKLMWGQWKLRPSALSWGQRRPRPSALTWVQRRPRPSAHVGTAETQILSSHGDRGDPKPSAHMGTAETQTSTCNMTTRTWGDQSPPKTHQQAVFTQQWGRCCHQSEFSQTVLRLCGLWHPLPLSNLFTMSITLVLISVPLKLNICLFPKPNSNL